MLFGLGCCGWLKTHWPPLRDQFSYNHLQTGAPFANVHSPQHSGHAFPAPRRTHCLFSSFHPSFVHLQLKLLSHSPQQEGHVSRSTHSPPSIFHPSFVHLQLPLLSHSPQHGGHTGLSIHLPSFNSQPFLTQLQVPLLLHSPQQ